MTTPTPNAVDHEPSSNEPELSHVIERIMHVISRPGVKIDVLMLAELQRDIDNSLRALLGDLFDIEDHSVDILPNQFVDSRRGDLGVLPKGFDPFLALVRALAKLREIQADKQLAAQRASRDVRQSRVQPTDPVGYLFVIHGRDHLVRDAVSGFIRVLGIPTVISMDSPSRGKTIIEKIEGAENTSLAVAIMTPDDFGHIAGGDPATGQLRARQNVIYEIGYFSGRLGRDRVCIVKAGMLEMPGDLDGIVTINFDSTDKWKIELAREIRSAGLAINTDEWL